MNRLQEVASLLRFLPFLPLVVIFIIYHRYKTGKWVPEVSTELPDPEDSAVYQAMYGEK